MLFYVFSHNFKSCGNSSLNSLAGRPFIPRIISKGESVVVIIVKRPFHVTPLTKNRIGMFLIAQEFDLCRFFIHSFIHSFVHSFVRSFVRSFVHFLTTFYIQDTTEDPF